MKWLFFFGLLGGLVLGATLVGGGLAVQARSSAQAAPAAQGDLNAPYDLTLTLTEAALASQLATPPQRQPGSQTLRDPAVRLRSDGTIQVRGTVTSYGLPLTARAILQPSIAAGKLRLAIIESQVGGVPLTFSIVDRLESTLSDKLSETMAQKSFQAVALVPGDGMLTVRLKEVR